MRTRKGRGDAVKRTYYIPDDTAEEFARVCRGYLSESATAAFTVWAALSPGLREEAIDAVNKYPPAKAIRIIREALYDGVPEMATQEYIRSLPKAERDKLQAKAKRARRK